jgi:hypothetical protein
VSGVGDAQITLDTARVAGTRLLRPLSQRYPVAGGGIYIATTAVITALNTLIARNVFSNGNAIPTGNDCFGLLRSLGNNLIQSTTNCSISGTTYGNVTEQDPLLGPLQNNDGPAYTRALLSGSPAVDAGSPTGCLATDQRGVVRPIDGNGDGTARCDIGAVERRTTLSLAASPNPVPAGTGAGSTTLQWNVSDGSTGQVYRSQNGGQETLFAEGVGSSKVIPVATGSVSVFRLYAGTSHSTVVRSLTVRRAQGLVVTPNPVPSGKTTTIAWNTGAGAPGQLWISRDGAAETLLKTAADGISSGFPVAVQSVYSVRLYAGTSHTTLLRSVAVRHALDLTASPSLVPIGKSTTTIAWTTGDGTVGQVWVSRNGGVETLFTQGALGIHVAAVTTGSSAVFRLYAGTSHTTLLRSVTVTHQ